MCLFKMEPFWKKQKYIVENPILPEDFPKKYFRDYNAAKFLLEL